MAVIRRRRMQHSASDQQAATKSGSSTTIGKNQKRQKKNTFSLRDQFMRTNVDIYLLGIFIIVNGLKLQQHTVEAADEMIDIIGSKSEIEQRINDEEVFAVFFPIFCQSIAILIYYLLTRYLSFIPYTAIVFLLGVGIGYNAEFHQTESAILLSSLRWLRVNGEVVLLVFLPGLIFLDAFTINVHLFFQAFWQLIIYAFPMVLAGSVLTGTVARYVLPYDWDWNLCMTFGSILSATDPVAVAGVFNALGAPPRMEMHLSGESLLNDGSSVLLFDIFSLRFFYGMNVEGFGQDIGWGEGVKLFFRLVGAGGLIGICFGILAVLMLKLLDRRLSAEENVAQVVLTFTAAYMSYFVADILCECSGIISTITCGLTLKILGTTLVSDVSLMLNFWRVLGELLNTLLFVLGGTLWGNIISPTSGDFQIGGGNSWENSFEGRDWGYLIALYLLLIVIRFLLVLGFYPINSRIGIGSNIKEAIFISFGGFRGTVGIALALSLTHQVYEVTDAVTCSNRQEEECFNYRRETNALFCLVGGVSFLTLTVNGLLAGPLLKLLKLSKSDKIRKKVVANYWKNMVEHILVDYVRLLSQERFRQVDFSLVREHVPFIGGITWTELIAAVDIHKRNTPPYLYATPNLALVIPYILQQDRRSTFHQNGYNIETFNANVTTPTTAAVGVVEQSLQSTDTGTRCSSKATQQRRESQANVFMKCNKKIFDPEAIDESIRDNSIDEERLNFIEILRRCYYEQISNGELDESGDLQYSLFQGLDFAEEAASKGQPLNDWNATKVASATNVVVSNRVFLIALIQIKLTLSQWKQAFKQMWTSKKCCCGTGDKNTVQRRLSSNYELFAISKISFSVRQSLAFRNAHQHAQKVFEEEFASYPLKPAEEKVIEESKAQVRLADLDLDGIDADDVNLIKGHLVCFILINKAIKFVEALSWQGLIPEKDATGMLELLGTYRERITLCRSLSHEGILDLANQSKSLRRLPPHIIEEFNLASIIETMARSAAVPNDVDTALDDNEIEEGNNLDDANEPEENSLFSSLRSRASLRAAGQ